MQRHTTITSLLGCLLVGTFFFTSPALADNQPPELNPIGNKEINQNSTLDFTVSAQDPENDTIEYSVYLAGDINHDGRVSIVDAVRIVDVITANGGSSVREGDPGWNPEMDVNNSSTISILDAVIVVEIIRPDGSIRMPKVITMDSQTGEFRWEPESELTEGERYRFTFIASDGELIDTESIIITVVEGPPVISDTELLDKTEAESALYFYNEALSNGLVKDGNHKDWASISATGFGLASLCVIADRYQTSSYWTITPEEARSRVNQILDTCLTIQDSQSPEGNEYGVAGFFYHFITEDLTRQGTSEVSTIDTAFLLAGAITAGEYFGGEVKTKTDQILSNIDWTYFLNDTSKQFHHSWFPESGLMPGLWDRPSDETILISLLAISSDPENPDFLETMFSWPRVEREYQGIRVVNSYFGSLFTYIFAHCFVDFEELGLDNPGVVGSSEPAIDWFANSRNAALANREFCIDNSNTYSSYGPNSWGITACEDPDGNYLDLLGSAPSEETPYHTGVIAPYGAISSLPLMRTSSTEDLGDNLAFRALRHYYDTYYNQLWAQYGPRASFNHQDQFSPNYLGINTGPQAIAIENYRTGLIWNKFMSNTRISLAADIIFSNRSVTLEPLNWIPDSVRPGETIITDSTQRIIVTNDGDAANTYTLRVVDSTGTWTPIDTPGGNDKNKFILSAVFTSIDQTGVDSSFFNQDTQTEDMLLDVEHQKSTSTKFATNTSSLNGTNVAPGEERSLWFKFEAPKIDTTQETKHDLWLIIEAERPTEQ